MNYAELAKESIELLRKTRASLSRGPVRAEIRTLAELYTSHINKCAYCLRIHSEEARSLGMSQEKLDMLPGWKNSIHFTQEERLVLAWVECTATLQGSSEEARAQLRTIYSDKEVADLTICISVMCAFNRIHTLLV